MARLADRHPANVEGDWYVDTRCIDCDACRQMAPTLLDDVGGTSVFVRQPSTDEELDAAWRAVAVCPTLSVGHVTMHRPPAAPFPFDEGDGVWRLGHNARSSFGAHSFLVQRPNGNLMIDAPRWTREVAEPVAAIGGVSDILLSHRDDVADADRYAEHFGARVWIHEADGAAAPYATDVLTGTEPVDVRPDVVGIPVPGHTRGSVLYLVDGHLLFTGDSLAWNPRVERLTAFRDACWYSWPEQTASLGRLVASGLRFDAVFAGHGWSWRAPADELHASLIALVARMPDESDRFGDW
jgi:glyoxylase-like metal-dependent hydrolase (beta-lactamase superfamily II)/ferredoxin